MKYLCTYEFDNGRINMNCIGEMLNLEEFTKRFDEYCENKDCDRVCPSDVHVQCILNYMFDNYVVASKESDCNE